LEIVREDVPEAYQRLQRSAPPAIAITLDQEELCLVSGTAGLEVTAAGSAELRVRTTRRTLLDLIEGRCSLLDALYDETFFVVGDRDLLLAAHEALVAFLQGAVRSPRMPALLHELRAVPGTAEAA
jgi:hypothetical protein